MGFKMTGDNYDTMRAGIEAAGEEAVLAAIEALDETVTRAENDIKRIIESSYTKTGHARAAAGLGVPGRIETGAMHESVKSSVTGYSGDSFRDSVVGQFGWLEETDEEVLQRAEYQDSGTERIAPMNAIFQAFALAVPELKARLAAKGFKVQ